ncbi:MAG TPA: WhiB family transcriptional regulator [Candidatus Paceibacterota bacterium]
MGQLESLLMEPPGGGSWEEDAACREHDSSLWLLSEDPDDKASNKSGFEQAEIVCSQCPVITQCWQYATDMDKRVTMRGGAWPTDYREPDPEPVQVCRSGHDLTVSGAKNAQGRCAQCGRERSRRYRKRVAEREREE